MYVRRDRIGEVSQFSDVSSRGDVDTLRMIIKRWVSSGERWRQTPIHGRVDELRALCEEQLAEMVKAQTSLLHGVRNSHGLEVTTVVNDTRFTVNEGIIGC